jgi:hypothetical protein
LCNAPGSISKVGSDEESAGDRSSKAGASSVCRLSESYGGKEEDEQSVEAIAGC